MSDFFANLRSGIQFPQVVMNQGPLPGMGGLPRPLHDTADGRINYNSALLGDLTPYAYGEPGYLSSQTAYLNIPHKIQKIVPQVFLPEARLLHSDILGLSHPVDDGDLAFTLRLDRNSLFCTGTRTGTRRMATGTAIDPLINLATVNYILAGLQMEAFNRDGAMGHSMWRELLQNLDPHRFKDKVHSANCVVSLDDIIHLVKHCIRPFGIVRGSEKQGGQNEATPSPATWPVCFVASVTLDGKESNVMNLWHHLDFSAGEDLVLCLKLMPLRTYTLNHYYKGIKTQTFSDWASLAARVLKTPPDLCVWQLCPNVMSLDSPAEDEAAVLQSRIQLFTDLSDVSLDLTCRTQYTSGRGGVVQVTGRTPWQDLGYWHIGRTQIMSGKYGVEEYWHNDNANGLRTNHLDITLQPMYFTSPRAKVRSSRAGPGTTSSRYGVLPLDHKRVRSLDDEGPTSKWEPRLCLERLSSGSGARALQLPRIIRRLQPPRLLSRPSVAGRAASERHGSRPIRDDDDGDEGDWDRMLGLPRPAAAALRAPSLAPAAPAAGMEEDIGTALMSFMSDEDEPAPPAPPKTTTTTTTGGSGAKSAGAPKKGGGRTAGATKRSAGGSLLRADGSSETGLSVGML